MKFLLTLALTIISFCSIFAQATRSTNYTLVATNISTVNIDLASEDIEVVETVGSRVIIEAKITLESIANTSMLEFLINSGRYELENAIDPASSSLTIKRKKETNMLMVKGKECREIVKYKILVPSSVKFVNISNPTASVK